MLLQHVSLLHEYIWKCISMKIGMLLQKFFHPIAICMPLLRVAKIIVPLSRPGTSRDSLSKSRPVPARRKILSSSRCPFVPGQGRNFCPFVPKSCTVPSRWKRYCRPFWGVERNFPALKQVQPIISMNLTRLGDFLISQRQQTMLDSFSIGHIRIRGSNISAF